jgi:hypothetical protein
MNVEQVLAALGFAVCVALLVYHWVGAQRQARLRWWWSARTAPWRRWVERQRQRRRARRLEQAQQNARAAEEALRGEAAREAADLIERAKRPSKPGHAAGSGTDAGDGDARDHSRSNHGNRDANGRGTGSGPASGDNVVRPPRFGNRRNDLH